MAQPQSIRTDLPFRSFSSVLTRIRNRSSTGDEEDKVHPHVLVVAPEWPAVDKLCAKKVLVPNIKAAEDLNFGSFPTTPATFGACSPLHAPHQPLDLTPSKLIVFPIWRRKPKVRKPVAAIVVQVIILRYFRGRCSAT